MVSHLKTLVTDLNVVDVTIEELLVETIFQIKLGFLLMTGAVFYNKIILDECSTVVEIDHVRNLIRLLRKEKWMTFGNIQYTYDDTGCNRLLAITGRGP